MTVPPLPLSFAGKWCLRTSHEHVESSGHTVLRPPRGYYPTLQESGHKAAFTVWGGKKPFQLVLSACSDSTLPEPTHVSLDYHTPAPYVLWVSATQPPTCLILTTREDSPHQMLCTIAPSGLLDNLRWNWQMATTPQQRKNAQEAFKRCTGTHSTRCHSLLVDFSQGRGRPVRPAMLPSHASFARAA